MNNGNGSGPEATLGVQTGVPARSFLSNGVEWLAWPSGASAYGTGACAPAAVEAVHFAPADASATPVFEALLPAGRFHGLYDEELIALLAGATKVVDPAQRPLKPVSRRGVGLL